MSEKNDLMRKFNMASISCSDSTIELDIEDCELPEVALVYCGDVDKYVLRLVHVTGEEIVAIAEADARNAEHPIIHRFKEMIVKELGMLIHTEQDGTKFTIYGNMEFYAIRIETPKSDCMGYHWVFGRTPAKKAIEVNKCKLIDMLTCSYVSTLSEIYTTQSLDVAKPTYTHIFKSLLSTLEATVYS